MGRVWPITLATAYATFSLAAGGCGDGERLDAGAAGTGGSTGGTTLMGEGGGHRGGSTGQAGDGELAGDGSGAFAGMGDDTGGSSQNGSGGSRPRGGGGSTSAGSGGTGGATAGGTAGTMVTGGSGGGGAEPGEAGNTGAGTGGNVVEQLDVCVRQTTAPQVLGWDVSRDFETAVNFDCRVSWVRLLYLDPPNGLDERVDFLNQLIHFGIDTWGCIGGSPPQTFDLIWEPTPLSALDVAVLIDHYVEAATGPLSLSPSEIADMRALLGKLAEPLLMDPDPGDFSNPRCETGVGGESGAGGHAGSG